MGFTSRGFINYHDNLAFSRLHPLNALDYQLPVEPDGEDFVLWWTFDGITYLEDRSFFGHIGEISGPWTCSILAEGVNEGIGAGGAICTRFNGDKYIKTYSATDTSTIGHLGITDKTEWSLFIRFKVDDPTVAQVLVEKNDDLNSNYSYRVAIVSNKLVFVVRINGSSTIRTISTTILADTWYDCWFIYDDGTLGISVNGSDVVAVPSTGGFSTGGFDEGGFDVGFDLTAFTSITTNAVGTAFLVGVDVSLEKYFTGYIQDVRFWKRVITSTEISNMWTNKVSISDIPFEKVAVVGFAAIKGPYKFVFPESWTISESFTDTLLQSNPILQTLNESFTFSDEVTPGVNITVPVNMPSETITFSDAVSTFKGSLQVKVGNIVKTTQTSGLPLTVNHSVEIGFRPKFIMFFGSSSTSYDDFTRDPRTFIGFTDGTNHIALSTSSNDDSSTMDAAKGLYSSAILNIDYDNNLEVRANCSFSENGFSLTYTENVSSARIINYIALGGSVISNVKVGSFAQPTSATGDHIVSTIGFESNLLMFIPTQFTTINSKSLNGAFLFGASDHSFNQFSIACTDVDNVGTSVTKRIARNDKAITLLGSETTGLNTVMKSASITNVDENGFTLNYDVNGAAGSAAGLCGYAAIKGINCVIGKFTPTTGTGIQTITNPNISFKPTLLIFMGHGKTLENNTTPSSEFRIGIGTGVDSLNRRCDTMHSKDNEPEGICIDYTRSSKAFALIQGAASTSDSTVLFTFDLLSTQQGGFVINKTTNSLGTSNDINYIAIG